MESKSYHNKYKKILSVTFSFTYFAVQNCFISWVTN